MSFLAPLFFAGLAALAVPILVHLTHKERKDVVVFPSLMFLSRIPYQAVRRQRIRHCLLFALRCLALIFLALAFARPFLNKSAMRPPRPLARRSRARDPARSLVQHGLRRSLDACGGCGPARYRRGWRERSRITRVVRRDGDRRHRADRRQGRIDDRVERR